MNLKVLVFGVVGLFSFMTAPVQAEEVLTEKQAEAEIAAFYGDPERMLKYSYHNYMIVSACYEVRKGLAVQYINKSDLDKAKRLGGEIQNVLLKKDASLNGDEVWKKAFEGFGVLISVEN